MTYRLAALRFRSVGERSARFTDLTLDLTAPVDEGTAPSDSVVWLRNGGGKSSILSLLYAMVLPAANDFMGKAVKRSLTDYVDSGDTSHVVAVWRPRDESRTLLGDPEDVLVTGAVHEWGDLRRPVRAADARDRLNSFFYAFHAVPGVLDLNTLPFTDADGRTRRLTGYVEALRGLAADHPRASLALTDRQYVWARALADRHLDPEIFRTQKQMNHVEGGVEDLFRFASAKEFIDFLLDLTTPPDAVNSVAQRLDGVMRLLAAKPAKLVERDFCTAAAEDLDSVAARHEQLAAARSGVRERDREAARLSAAFHGTITEATEQAAALSAELTAARSALSRANTDKSGANDLAYLYRRQAARLSIEEAEAGEDEAHARADEARRRVEDWEVAGRLAALSDVRGALDQAELAAAAEEEEIAPLRAERDRHATVLAHRLTRLAARADADAEQAEDAARTAAERAADHETLRGAAEREKEAAISAAATARQRLDELAGRLRACVKAGHLPAADGDLTAHLTELVRRRDEHDRRRLELKDAAGVRRNRRKEIAGRSEELGRARADLMNARRHTADLHAALSDRLADLTSSGRLRNLAEATADEPIDLWGEGPTLLRRLGDAVLAADDERVRRRAELHADRRMIETQERNGVLPTTLDAERVEALLTTAGVPAESGWAHLRAALPADRLTEILEIPGIARLGCGVVVPADSLAAAVRVLTAHDTVTTSLVHVYSAADADALVRRAAERPDAVAPAWGRIDPGLVDPALAEAAVRVLKERARAYKMQDGELAARRTEDDELRRSLERFLIDCPAGRLDGLRTETERADARIGETDAELGALQGERDGLDAEDLRDEAAREEVENGHRALSASIERLDELIPLAAERPRWEDEARNAQEAADLAQERMAEHSAGAVNASLEAERHRTDARQHRALARDQRSEASGLTVRPFGEAGVADEPSVPVDALRNRWEAASRALEIRASKMVLADRVLQLGKLVEERERQLGDVPPENRARAEALLTSPDGQEDRLRKTALRNAEAALAAAEQDRGKAVHLLEQRRSELTEIERRHRQAPRRALPTVPRTSAEAAALAAEQDELGQQAQERVSRAEGVIDDLGGRIARAEDRAEHFRTLAGSLPDPGPSPEPPFPGDTEEGRAAARRITDARAEAETRRGRCENGLNQAIDALRQTATRFPSVEGPVKDRVANDGITVLAPHAATLAARLRLRAQTLAQEIDAIAADQTIIGEALAHLVREGFDTLAKAERASRMPTAHGSWAGKKVLRISFDRPADGDLTAYAERVIDRFVAKGLRPEGMPLLKAALHEAAGARGFVVKVLKPTTDEVTTTEDISRLAKWSGGEKLTVCVALYCTLAALRAAAAGRKGRSGGVLLLDNPIGRASSAPLVRLQRDVAAAHGIQLVYTTGVKDSSAVVQFPNVIRLDNREGRSRSRRYIVSADDPPGGTVTGVRVAREDT